MIFMTILKVIFTLLLCVPLVYIIIYFLFRLIDEVVKQNKDEQAGADSGAARRSGRRRQR